MSAINNPPVTTLLSAASHGDLGEVRCLVLEGANVNARDHDGYTALTYAARQGNLDIVTYLLNEGARVDPHEDFVHYDSPLSAAIRGGHLAVAIKLIECGADPLRHTGVLLETAGFYAQVSGQKSIHEYLARITGAKGKAAAPGAEIKLSGECEEAGLLGAVKKRGFARGGAVVPHPPGPKSRRI